MTRRTAVLFKQSGERGIGLGKKISGSLSAQLLCGVLASLGMALLTFFLVLELGNTLLDHTVYGQPFAYKAADKQFDELQKYVASQKITPENIRRLNAWCRQERKVNLSVYIDEQIVFASSYLEQTPNLDEWEIQDEDPENLYELTFSDETAAQVFLYYYAGDAFYFGIAVLSVLAAFLVFSVCFIFLIHRKLLYVKKLKEELDILSGGSLEYPVTVQGTDELGQLAYGIDQMRRSILAHQRTEERNRSANSQLVTAMSHDLRTPLTSLLAYLELIDRGRCDSDEQLHLFVKKSLDKAFRIKTMADQMFEYFLVYSAEWEQPDMESQDADTLLGQFWSDYAFSLESKGFLVQTDFQPLGGMVQVNLELLRRAFDNLYSNLLKYADSGKMTEIAFKKENGQVQLKITNHISPLRDKRESTHIGLNTCRRILEYHNGGFSAEEQDGIFTVILSLPLQTEI